MMPNTHTTIRACSWHVGSQENYRNALVASGKDPGKREQLVVNMKKGPVQLNKRDSRLYGIHRPYDVFLGQDVLFSPPPLQPGKEWDIPIQEKKRALDLFRLEWGGKVPEERNFAAADGATIVRWDQRKFTHIRGSVADPVPRMDASAALLLHKPTKKVVWAASAYFPPAEQPQVNCQNMQRLMAARDPHADLYLLGISGSENQDLLLLTKQFGFHSVPKQNASKSLDLSKSAHLLVANNPRKVMEFNLAPDDGHEIEIRNYPSIEQPVVAAIRFGRQNLVPQDENKEREQEVNDDDEGVSGHHGFHGPNKNYEACVDAILSAVQEIEDMD